MEDPLREVKLVYLTGYNAVGKTSLGRSFCEKHADWHCIDGDDFADNDPEFKELFAKGAGAMNSMRGSFVEENHEFIAGSGEFDFHSETLLAEVTKHDAEVRAAWEPFFRRLFEKLQDLIKEQGFKQVLFVYHCWRQWTLDVLQEYFGPSSSSFSKSRLIVVEVQTSRSVMLERFVQRQVENGVDHETIWRERGGEVAELREKYGAVYQVTGNSGFAYKKFCEWRYFFYREPVWKAADNHMQVISNDNFQAEQELEKILSIAKSEIS
eukprot:TRINITY_DN69166_c0_g1_i1.p1 TRINITY_DN69166_c0_g1~~TRINITY_DN69166_c0_g1_i1.p1  ORF type:complete len:277 (-),score=18.41 TRINITY_DN69166_c0_g1_i1:200-1000(-)